MTSEIVKKLYVDATFLKSILLKGRNIDMLLFLAKYNPNVDRQEIEEKFGKESLKGLEDLKKINLVMEDRTGISLTTEGIFQIDGLLTMVA